MLLPPELCPQALFPGESQDLLRATLFLAAPGLTLFKRGFPPFSISSHHFSLLIRLREGARDPTATCSSWHIPEIWRSDTLLSWEGRVSTASRKLDAF